MTPYAGIAECACFDRVLPRNLLRPGGVLRGSAGRVRAIAAVGRHWMNGSTLRVQFIGGDAAQRSVVRQQALRWSERANLRFAFDEPADVAEIRVAFDPDGGHWCYVGTDAQAVAAPEPTMNLASVDPGIVAHELGHATGLEHEWPGNIEWNEEAVIAAMAGPPNHWTPEQTRRHFLSLYDTAIQNGLAPDPQSIMTLFVPGAWTRSGVAVAPHAAPSVHDAAFAVLSWKYPRARS